MTMIGAGLGHFVKNYLNLLTFMLHYSVDYSIHLLKTISRT